MLELSQSSPTKEIKAPPTKVQHAMAASLELYLRAMAKPEEEFDTGKGREELISTLQIFLEANK